MYASHDDEEGKIRIRFESLSKRLNKINVDILHKEPDSYHLQTTLEAPDTGALGCFTFDEFELLKTSDNSVAFKRLFNQVGRLVQSLPELLHHQAQIVEHFVKFVNSAPAKDLASAFSLISVLTRDLDKDVHVHFHVLFGALVGVVSKVAMSGGVSEDEQTPNPELTGKLFETLSYLLKANISKLMEAPEELSPYYGPLLGNPVQFVRDFAAKSFVIVTRKLSNKVFKEHYKRLMKATSVNILSAVGFERLLAFLEEYQGSESDGKDDTLDMKRSRWLVHGLSQLMFNTCKGVTGQMHSKAVQRLDCMGKVMLSFSEHSTFIKGSQVDENKVQSMVCQVSVCGIVIASAVQQLQEHVDSENQKDLLTTLLAICQDEVNVQKQYAGVSEAILSSLRPLISTTLLLKVRMLLQLLEGRKGKTMRGLDTVVLSSFLEACFSACRGVQQLLHHDVQLTDDLIVLASRRLSAKLWIAFPTNKLVLSNIKGLIEAQCLEIKPTEAALYFANELLTNLPKSTAFEHAVPLLAGSAGKLRSKMADQNWLALLLHTVTLMKDSRLDLEKLQNRTLNIETTEFYEYDLDVGESLLACLEEVSAIFLRLTKAIKSGSLVSIDEEHSLVFALKLLKWFGDHLPFGHLSLVASSKAMLSLVKAELKTKPSNGWMIFRFPDLLLLLCTLVDCVEDIEAARVTTDAVKAISNHFMDTPPKIGLAFAMNALIEKLTSSVEDAPEFFLSSLLSKEQSAGLLNKLAFALTTPSHWLKIELVRILGHFQPPMGEIMWRNDEEIPAEPMNVAKLCLECLCYPVDLQHEREISRRLEIMEVWCRGTKLPEEFLAIASGFCIGILNVKFKPLWTTAIKVLVTISQTTLGEEILWKMVEQFFGFNSPSIVHYLSRQYPDGVMDSCAKLMNAQEDMGLVDSGLVSFPIILAQSSLHWWKVSEDVAGASAVLPDARADTEMVYASVFELLQKAPHVTLKRSKVVVGAFLRFLRTQYYQVFPDEPEISSLNRYGLFIVEQGENEVTTAVMTMKQLKVRLEAYLSALAAVQSPKQLFRHQVLYIIYGELLCKPDASVSKLAMECILSYKQPEIVPYKDSLRKLYDDRAFRNELIALSTVRLSEDEEEHVKGEHKADLFPLIIRILFGRLTGRSGGKRADREQTSSRRAAVLTFVSTIEPQYIGQLLYLMIRGITPVAAVNQDDSSKVVEFKQNVIDYKRVSAELNTVFEKSALDFMKIDSGTLSRVYWDKLIGFLYLLDPTISILALGLTDYLLVIYNVLEQMLIYAHTFKASTNQLQKNAHVDEEETEEAACDNDIAARKETTISDEGKYSANVRTMCLQRMTDLLSTYNAVFDFNKHCTKVFDTILPLITALPSSIISASRPPALLLLLDQVSRHEKSFSLLSSNKLAISAVIACVAVPRSNLNVNKMILEILERLLEVGEGRLLRPFAQELVVMFSRRFVGSQADTETELKLSDVSVGDIQSIKHELSFLCRVGTLIFADASVGIERVAANNLATLVLGLVRLYAFSGKRIRVSEDWVINVLQIYKSLIWRISDATSHAAFVARLFGPSVHSSSHFNSSNVRTELALVYVTLSSHSSVSSTLTPLSTAMEAMTKLDGNLLEGRDYNSLIPVFQALAGEASSDERCMDGLSWDALMGPTSWNDHQQRPITGHLTLCSAVVYETLRCMYDGEMFVRRSALASLKQLAVQCVQWDAEAGDVSNTDIHLGWLNLFQSILIPALRKGIKYSNDNVKGGFLSLLAHMVRVFAPIEKLQQNDLYHCDLMQLTHIDPDQDFFENITHIQVHRRARAFAKLRAALVSAESQLHLRVSSFVHVLLPICFHYLYADEYSKKLHQKLLEEASLFIGAVALHLPWNHYYGIVKRLIQMLDKANEDKEKCVQTALCSSLDAFHFDMTVSDISGVLVKPVETSKEEVVFDPSTGVVDDDDVEIREDHGVEEEEDPVEVTEAAVVVEVAVEDPEEKNTGMVITNAIAASVVRTIIPWLKAQLVKEVKDQHGKKTEKIQTSIALALANLIKHLEPPVVTAEVRMTLFSSIVINIVNTLKSRDVKVRDVARTSLAKMIGIIGLGALRPVLFELQSILREGYQRHVSTYTVRSLLASILEEYQPPADAPVMDLNHLDNLEDLQANFHPLIPAFDSAIPYIMAAVLEDLSEDVKQAREVDGVIRSTSREQKGSKYTEILEITGRCILFRPTYALLQPSRPAAVSSIHAIVGPLLLGLQGAESTLIYNRMAEALQRLCAGLAKNPSICDKELLLYLHSTLQPFVGTMLAEHRRYKHKMGQLVVKAATIEEELSDMETGLPSYLTDEVEDDEPLTFMDNGSSVAEPKRKKNKGDISLQAAAQWLPTEWTALKGQRAVVEERNRQQRDQFKVLDGANAPKLTGRNRYDKLMLSKGNHNASTSGVSRTTLVAIKFCLTLFHSSLKKGVLPAKDDSIQSMVLPFIPLLKSFLYITGASDVLVLSIKCIGALISWGVELQGTMANDLASKVIKIMIRHGASISTENDLCQACVQVLVALFKRHNEEKSKHKAKKAFPLSEEQLRSLVEMLTISITAITSSFQSSSFQLIKEIINARILLPEIYDLIVKLTEQIVLSHRKGIRDTASAITIQFMLTYPLSQQRAESHLKQLINNCDYEFEEGRAAALGTLLAVVRALPKPVVQEYAQMIFLSLTLKLVNETSSLCRDNVVNVISALIERSGEEYCKLFQDYAFKWLQALSKHTHSNVLHLQAITLVRIGAQALTIICKVAPAAFSSNTSLSIKQIVSLVHTSLIYFLSCEEASSSRQETSKLVWNAVYHLLLLTEQLYSANSSSADHAVTHISCEELKPEVLDVFKVSSPEIHRKYNSMHFMDIVSDLILYPHPWVRASASRLVLQYCQLRQQKRKRLALYSDGYDILAVSNGFYTLMRKLCVLLNQATLPEGLEQAVTSCTVSMLSIMIAHPEMDTYTPSEVSEGEDDQLLPVSFNPETGDYRDQLEEVEGEMVRDEAENIVYSIDHAEDLSPVQDSAEDAPAGLKLTGKRSKPSSAATPFKKTRANDAEDEVEDKDAGVSVAADSDNSKRGLAWAMQRLRAIGADIRGQRRQHVLKVMLGMAKKADKTSFLQQFVSQIIEVPVRVVMNAGGAARLADAAATDEDQTVRSLAQDLLKAMEQRLGASAFMEAFAKTQMMVQSFKSEKKRKLRVEAVTNPRAFTQRKILRTVAKRQAKKRQTEKRVAFKGIKRRKVEVDKVD